MPRTNTAENARSLNRYSRKLRDLIVSAKTMYVGLYMYSRTRVFV